MPWLYVLCVVSWEWSMFQPFCFFLSFSCRALYFVHAQFGAEDLPIDSYISALMWEDDFDAHMRLLARSIYSFLWNINCQNRDNDLVFSSIPGFKLYFACQLEFRKTFHLLVKHSLPKSWQWSSCLQAYLDLSFMLLVN